MFLDGKRFYINCLWLFAALVVYTANAQPIPAANPVPTSNTEQNEQSAQRDPSEMNRPVPVIAGGAAFNASFRPGNQTIDPTFAPIFLVPFGKRLLFEAEFESEGVFSRDGGMWGPRQVSKSIEYLQMDYFAHPNLTIVVGHYLTPFGQYNERLHPLWIRDLQDAPMIFGMTHGSGTGGMLRGGARLSSNVNINYAGYFSGASTIEQMDSERQAGGRGGVFFPNQRVELAFSFNRRLGMEKFNIYGVDATWNLKKIPLDVRAEVAKSSELGSGYWIEGAYRLTHVSRRSFFHKSQIVVRGEQFFTPMPPADVIPDYTGPSGPMISQQMARAGALLFREPLTSSHIGRILPEHFGAVGPGMNERHGGAILPDDNTQRAYIGWNYYLQDGLKFSLAYGRNYATGENHHLWSIGLSYRFGF